MELENPIICTIAKIILIVTSSYSFSKLPEMKSNALEWIFVWMNTKQHFCLSSIFMKQLHLYNCVKFSVKHSQDFGESHLMSEENPPLWWVLLLRESRLTSPERVRGLIAFQHDFKFHVNWKMQSPFTCPLVLQKHNHLRTMLRLRLSERIY